MCFFPMLLNRFFFTFQVNLRDDTFFSGWLLIAEVKSRFDPNTGGADPNTFSKAICELGFTSISKVYSCSLRVRHIFVLFILANLLVICAGFLQ